MGSGVHRGGRWGSLDSSSTTFCPSTTSNKTKQPKNRAAATPAIQLVSGKNWHTSMREGAGCARSFINDTRGQRKEGWVRRAKPHPSPSAPTHMHAHVPRPPPSHLPPTNTQPRTGTDRETKDNTIITISITSMLTTHTHTHPHASQVARQKTNASVNPGPGRTTHLMKLVDVVPALVYPEARLDE